MESMEAPTPNCEWTNIKKPVKKPNNSIELNLKSDKNSNYDISIYFSENKLYFNGISKDQFENKTYEKIYSIEEVKLNKFFYLHETVKEVYDELNLLIKNYKDINEIKLLEEKNRLILIFPLNSIKVKECVFEINEIFKSNSERFEIIMDKLKEMQDKFLGENNLLKNQIREIKQENKELKEQISKNKINIQSGEYTAFFPCGQHYMNKDEGVRTFTQHINFEKKYEVIPRVMVSLSSIDACTFNNKNIRVKVNAANIDTSGFDIQIITWFNSSLFEVKVSWISYL